MIFEVYEMDEKNPISSTNAGAIINVEGKVRNILIGIEFISKIEKDFVKGRITTDADYQMSKDCLMREAESWKKYAKEIIENCDRILKDKE